MNTLTKKQIEAVNKLPKHIRVKFWDNQDTPHGWLIKEPVSTKISAIIASAFIWDTSAEGYKYWDAVKRGERRKHVLDKLIKEQ